MRASLAAVLVAALVLVPAAQAESAPTDVSLTADLSLVPLGDSSDLGTLLVEQVAFAADVLSFYQDRIANEAFLGTSTGDHLTLRVAWALGAATIHCVVVRVEGESVSGPCAAQGGIAGTGTWTGRFEGRSRLSVEVRLRVVCQVCRR